MEQFLLFSTIFCHLFVGLHVKTGTRFSLRDKWLFEISEVKITRVDCMLWFASENLTEPLLMSTHSYLDLSLCPISYPSYNHSSRLKGGCFSDFSTKNICSGNSFEDLTEHVLMSTHNKCSFDSW